MSCLIPHKNAEDGKEKEKSAEYVFWADHGWSGKQAWRHKIHRHPCTPTHLHEHSHKDVIINQNRYKKRYTCGHIKCQAKEIDACLYLLLEIFVQGSWDWQRHKYGVSIQPVQRCMLIYINTNTHQKGKRNKLVLTSEYIFFMLVW